MNYIGLITAVATFLIIGLFHPIVIKGEYHFGTRPWWVFLLLGLMFIAGSLFIENSTASTVLGVIGWFPMNPKRKDEYKPKKQADEN
jgi:hypothetical protein